jgi:glycosyltransferase involved in cell wall biosynthesis
MPLPDTAYTRGKCAYKLLQYAATGLPLVGSPIGANKQALATLGGLTPIGVAEWQEAGQMILDMSSSGREGLGNQARSQVERHFSYEAWKPVWLDALGVGSPGDVKSKADK